MTAAARHAPSQDPVLLLEARLPSPAVLYAGDKVPLTLMLCNLAAESDDAPCIQPRSLAVSLQSTTTATVGVDCTTWTSSRSLLRLGGLRRVVGSSRERDVLAEVNGGMPQGIAIPNVTPSFTTCTVRHEHSLEVTAGFSSLENHAISSALVWNAERMLGI
ncbi:hypothetical protein NEMBOFW57_009478 [Staphylotrichum longicolle]|uniref:Uncharacterized protein n=1 Tax=Staphylotrichum longicolle TaxID=669026 RepID=A0AAD4EP41_9PEZI|nr:hypothetical protein NEMBOFW57_009478 [Staphylotrichum longicolle]